eukprot:3438028-Rhodomonas_salina.1
MAVGLASSRIRRRYGSASPHLQVSWVPAQPHTYRSKSWLPAIPNSPTSASMAASSTGHSKQRVPK